MVHADLDDTRQWQLPPLILHPFADSSGPAKLADCSRASLMLQGFLPNKGFTAQDLNRKVIDGRYYEIRMLFYVGLDLNRWLDQCMEIVSRDETLQRARIDRESFVALLLEDPPLHVAAKLRSWGVTEYRVIFSRALGLNCIFAVCPERELLAEEFIRFHYRYADRLFQCRHERSEFARIHSGNFPFDIYASGEYARLLERQWEGAD